MDNILKELVFAYNTEFEGYGFYRAAAEAVTDPKGKNLFEHLSKEELDHIKVVRNIADSIRNGTGWLKYEDALKGDAIDASIFPESNELINRLKRDSSDIAAVRIGIEIEDNAVNFYARLLKDAKSPVEKTALTQLLEMEKGHLKLLRWEGESLQKNGFWCGSMEFSVEKEAD